MRPTAVIAAVTISTTARAGGRRAGSNGKVRRPVARIATGPRSGSLPIGAGWRLT
jgi:hypothetical protein